jgi:hypothetical protein
MIESQRCASSTLWTTPSALLRLSPPDAAACICVYSELRRADAGLLLLCCLICAPNSMACFIAGMRLSASTSRLRSPRCASWQRRCRTIQSFDHCRASTPMLREKTYMCCKILVYVRTLSGDCDGDCYLMSLRTSRSGPQCQWLSLVGHCQQTVHRVTPTSVCFTTPVQPQHGRCAALEGWQLAVACLDVMLQMRGYVWWKLICALGEHGCIDDCCFVRRRWCQTQAIFRYANQHAELRCSLSCSQPCPCTPERAKSHRAVSGRAIHPGSRCLCCRPHT